MASRKHVLYLTTGLLILALLTPATYANARGKQEESRQPVAVLDSSVTILRDRDYLPALKDAFDKAKKEITLSFYHFKTKDSQNSDPDIILASLIRASRRGVKVLVLLEQGRDPGESNTQENMQTLERLKKVGVTVYLDSPATTTHTKMAVVDGKYTFVGSHNLTQSALRYNHEISVLIESPQLATEALNYIAALLPRL